VRTCEEDLGLIEANRDRKPVITVGGLEDRISWRILLQFFSFVESIVRRLEWSNKCVGLSMLEVLFVFVCARRS
jgi:hypothetical protein